VQPGEVKRRVDVVSFDVMFNLSKLLSESLAILVILLNIAHAPSLLLFDGATSEAYFFAALFFAAQNAFILAACAFRCAADELAALPLRP
jgi:hypothetical protein